MSDKKIPYFEFQDEIPKPILSNKIHQIDLPKNLQHQLETELKDLIDVCDLRALIAQTINYLSIIGGDPQEELLKVMKKLHLKPRFDVKTFQYITLCHVNSVLIFLGYIRAKRMILNKQNPFNELPEKYQKQIENKNTKNVDDKILVLLHKVPPDAVALNLFGFIDFLSHSIDEVENMQTPLRDGLLAYMEDSGLVEESIPAREIHKHFDENINYEHVKCYFERLIFKITQI